MKFVIIVIVVILLIYIISKRNSFNELRRSIKHQESSIGIQIEKRSRCLHDAMNIAQLACSHEVGGMERLTARDQLNQLAYLGEKYPSLSSHSSFTMSIHEAFELNRDITASKEMLDGNINRYNNAITSFPGLLVAAMFGYKPEKFVDEDSAAENRKMHKQEVDFSQYSQF